MTKSQSPNPRQSRWVHLAVALGLATTILSVLFNMDPSNDVAHLYARQVRLIAVGDIERGLFLFPPPLMILIAGAFAALGMSAFAALKLVSGLFFVAGLWPLGRIVDRTIGTRFVPWAALLYIACPRILRYATMGTMDTAKMFFLLATVALLFHLRDKPKWRTSLALGAATAGLALTRGETVFFIPPILCTAAWCAWTGTKQRTPAHRSNTRAMALALGHAALLALVAGLLLLPQALRIQRYTGIPALDSRQVMRFTNIANTPKKTAALLPTPSTPSTTSTPSAPSDNPQAAPAPPPNAVEILPPSRMEDRVTVWRNIRETFKGLHPFMVVFALVGLGIKLHRRKWSWHDTAFAGVIAFNILLFASNGFITKRYIAPTMPFLLPWTVTGLAAIKDQWLDRIAPRAFPTLAALFLIVGLWDGLSDVRPSWDFEPEECHVLGLWIDEHRDQLPDNDLGSLEWNAASTVFHDGRQPVIAAASPQISFWARADWVPVSAKLQHSYPYLVSELRENRVDLLAVEDAMLRSCPDFFQHQHRHFTEIKGLPENIGIRLFHFHPEGVAQAEPDTPSPQSASRDRE